MTFYNSVRIRSHIRMHFLDLSPREHIGAFTGFRPGTFWSLLCTSRQLSLKEIDVTIEDNNKT